METLRLYRVFKYLAHEVWSADVSNTFADRLRLSGWPVQEHLPHIVTKTGAPFLAKYLYEFMSYTCPTMNKTMLDHVLKVIEAYPASYHHGATQEIGIALALNENIYQHWPAHQWMVVDGGGKPWLSGLTHEDVRHRRKARKSKPVGLSDATWLRLKHENI